MRLNRNATENNRISSTYPRRLWGVNRAGLRLTALLALLAGFRPGVMAAELVAIPGASESMDIDACVGAALTTNAALAAQRIARDELSGQMTQARATGLPTVDLTGNWSRSRDPSFAFSSTFAGEDDSGGFVPVTPSDSSIVRFFDGFSFLPSPEDIEAETYWRASVNARWELRPGLVWNAVGAAGLGIDRQEAAIADAEHRTVEAAMSSYYNVIRSSEQLAALQADFEAKQEFLDVARKRNRLGLATPLDTLRAAVSLANVTPLLRKAKQDMRTAGSTLNVMMGREPLAPLSVTGAPPIEEASIEGDMLTIERVADRPDIRQVDLLESILRKNRGAQKADHRPYLAANASYGYVTTALGELTDTGHDFWSASLTLTVPLFDGLLTRGKVQETNASIRRIHYEGIEAQRQAWLELQGLIGDLDAARGSLLAMEMNLQAAADAQTQVLLRYEMGKADYLSVLNVQSDRFLAQSNYIQARNEVLTLTASLKRALGFSPQRSLAEIRNVLLREAKISGERGEGRR